jgi:DNA-binding MarR family transcriptional regulator
MRKSKTDNDLQDVMGCTCLRIRRTTRLMTQIYERALEGIGLTINQFGLLANLYGVDHFRSTGLSMGALSERLGTDPTTLNRTLKPLAAKRLVKNTPSPEDARVRIVCITEDGKREFLEAIPSWRLAQARVESALGTKTKSALNDLLDLCSDALSRSE